MNKLLSAALAILLSCNAISAQNRTYFVSPSGNDAADGLSVASAWKSLDKVSATTFLPGDRILLQGGAVFEGKLNLKGSGTADAPIVLTGFGEGRPVISLGRLEGAAVSLLDAGGWEIVGLEVTSGAAPEVGVARSGILVSATGDGAKYDYLVVKDNYVHDIWGQMGGTRALSAAINVNVTPARTDKVPPTFDNVLIEGNRIERVDKIGITTSRLGKLKVRRNWMDNLGGDGIIVRTSYRAVVEFNEIHRSCMRSGDLNLPGDTAWAEGKSGWWPHTAACWIDACEETVMQFNEVYDTGRQVRNGDGFAYDFDIACKRCVLQYNYSKENHGFLLLMYDIFENVARYNISENDRTHLVQMQGLLKEEGNLLYNNVFYVDHGTSNLEYFRGDFKESAKDPATLGAHFYNNIFYSSGQGRFGHEYATGYAWDRSFDYDTRSGLPAGSVFLHNCYYGPWLNGIPDDPEALVADPKFVAPGTGGTGLGSLGGYRLRADSPCINAGMYVPSAGSQDFFGNPLSDGSPDFGAFEYLGSGKFADPERVAAADAAARDASELAWSKWIFPTAIAAGDPAKVSVVLFEPLAAGITGSISWVNPKTGRTVTAPIEKSKDRGCFVLPLKTDAATLAGTSVKVSLRNGEFSEEWEIPFAEKTVMHRFD